MESVDEGTFSTEIGATESLQLHSIAFLLTILSGLSTAFEPSFEDDDDGEMDSASKREGVAGIATAIGMCLHNLPEGVGIYVSCMSGLDVGLPIAIAIVLHVIPEGMAVAAPIYHATNDKWQAMKWAMISGACQPLGALTFALFFSSYLTPYFLQSCLAGVAGILTFLSITELAPVSMRYLSLWEAGICNLFGAIVIHGTVSMVESFLGVVR